MLRREFLVFENSSSFPGCGDVVLGVCVVLCGGCGVWGQKGSLGPLGRALINKDVTRAVAVKIFDY